MAQTDLVNFFQAASADSALSERFKTSGTAEAMVQVANEAGFAVTASDFEALVSAGEQEVQDLNDEALAGVSGGFFLSAIAKKYGLEPLGQLADDLIGAAVNKFAPKLSDTYDFANKII